MCKGPCPLSSGFFSMNVQATGYSLCADCPKLVTPMLGRNCSFAVSTHPHSSSGSVWGTMVLFTLQAFFLFLPMSCSFLLCSWLVPCGRWATSIFSCHRWGSFPCKYYVDAQLPQQKIFARKLKSKWRQRMWLLSGHGEDWLCWGWQQGRWGRDLTGNGPVPHSESYCCMKLASLD